MPPHLGHQLHLHFNMLLLNLKLEEELTLVTISFTFQYASIKPTLERAERPHDQIFTFQYASIKPTSLYFLPQSQINYLHFNMLLLNLAASVKIMIALAKFTFQYASIKP